MKKGAIFSVLSKKFRDKEIKIVEGLRIEDAKTKTAAAALRLLLAVPKNEKKFDALLIPHMEEKNMFRVSANLTKTKVLHPSSLNVYDLLNYKNVIIEKETIPFMEKHYGSIKSKASSIMKTNS